MKKIFTLLTVLGLSVMGLKAQQVWTGTVSSDWNNASNWQGLVVPPDTGRITIPAVVAPAVYPSLTANTRVDNINIATGATLNLNGQTLTVLGRVAGAGQIIGSPTSGIYAGGTGVVIHKDSTQHIQEFSATPANFFENFVTLDNPGPPGYGTIEFGNANLTFDVSASASVGDVIIRHEATPPNPLFPGDFLTVGEAANGINIILTMNGTEDVTSFSGSFFMSDLGFQGLTGQSDFNLRVKFKDGSPDLVSAQQTLVVTGAPVFIGVVTNRAISQIVMEPLRNNAFASMANLRFGRRSAFGTLNMDQTGTNNVLGSLTADILVTDSVKFAATTAIANVVDPNSGTIFSDGKLKLLSSATGTARVASHTDSGRIAGAVAVERFIPSGRKNQWRFLSFPYSAPTAISSITGTAFDFALANTQAPSSIKYFDPTTDNGLVGAGNNALGNTGYVAFPNAAATIASGQGVAAWLYGTTGAASQGTLASALTIASSGLLNESGVAYSKTLQLGTNGWNLVGNPFASTIDWNSAGITKTNLDSTVYRWNPEAVNWSTYNSTTGVATGQGSRFIESGAAFFVKALAVRGTPAVSFAQSAKVADAGTADHLARNGKKLDIASQRMGTAPSYQLSGLRVKTSATGNPIPADIYLDLSKSDASAGYDNKYDAIAMGRTAGADVKFVGEQDEFAVQFDAPIKTPGTEKRYYPLTVSAPQQGAASIDVAVEGTWNTLNTVSLIDTKDNKTIPMVGGKLSYAFKMDELKEEGRFMLAINHVAAKGVDNSKEVTVRVLNNPVRSETIQALISHPSAKAKNWSVLSASGSAMSNGQINPADASVQHELRAGKLNSNGVYYLKVNFENGDSKTVRFVKL
jgi:hypothetical protein